MIKKNSKSDNILRKFIDVIKLSNWQVESDEGWTDIESINKTIKYEEYLVVFESGKKIRCADNHIFIDIDNNEVFAKDSLDISLKTTTGYDTVLSVVKMNVYKHMYDLSLPDSSSHLYYANGVLSHNTTCYTILALHYTIFNSEKKILIAANKKDGALEVLSRIQLGYENLPNWIKPGLSEWNKSSITFSNLSSIKGVATSSDSARGSSANLLICDEFGFCRNSIAESFWGAVYPVVSSAKGTKVIIVSTPNGVGNLYHQIWEQANSNIKDMNADGWQPFRVDWWEVPGRDEEWKKMQIESIGHDRWLQEFCCSFLASSFKKLVSDDILDKWRQKLKEYEKIGFSGEDISIPGQRDGHTFTFKMWHDFDPTKTYLASGDVADGSGGDASVLYVWDITSINNITMCAKFSSNNVTVLEFAYIISRILSRYCNPVFAVESNSIGRGLIDQLKVTYDYDNFVKLSKNDRDGIMSHVQIKSKACLWFKEMLTTLGINIAIYDKNVVDEADNFVKKDTQNHLVYSALGKNAHDDHMMAFIWGMYILNNNILSKYYTILETMTSSLGKVLPMKIAPSNFYDLSKQDKELAPNELDKQWEKMKSEIKEESVKAFENEKMWNMPAGSSIETDELDMSDILFSMSGGGGWS
jgi:hypothetical protein